MSRQLWWRVHSYALILTSLFSILTSTHSHAVPDLPHELFKAVGPSKGSTPPANKPDCQQFFQNVIGTNGEPTATPPSLLKETKALTDDEIRFLRFLTALEEGKFRTIDNKSFPEVFEYELWHQNSGMNPFWKKKQKRTEIEKKYGNIPSPEILRAQITSPKMRQLLRRYGAEHGWLATPEDKDLSQKFAEATVEFKQNDWEFVLKAFYHGFENDDGTLNIMRPLWLHELVKNTAHFHGADETLKSVLDSDPEPIGRVPSRYSDILSILDSPAAKELHQVPAHIFGTQWDKSFLNPSDNVSEHDNVVMTVVKQFYGNPVEELDAQIVLQAMYKASVEMPTFSPVGLFVMLKPALIAMAPDKAATFDSTVNMDRSELASFIPPDDHLSSRIVWALRDHMNAKIEARRTKSAPNALEKQQTEKQDNPAPKQVHVVQTNTPASKLTADAVLKEVKAALASSKPSPQAVKPSQKEIDAAKRLAEFFRAVDEQMPERTNIIEAFRLALIGKTHINFEGPAGTGKSMLARVAQQIEGSKFFDMQFTQETSVDDVFGPLDIEAFQQGKRKRALEGHAADANIAFLDEVGDAPMRMRRALLTLLNERKMRIGGEGADALLDTAAMATNMSRHDDIEQNGKSAEAYYDRITYHALFPGQLSHMGSLLRMPEEGKLKLPDLTHDDIDALRELQKKIVVPEEVHLAALALFREMKIQTAGEQERSLTEYYTALKKAKNDVASPYVSTRIFTPRSANQLRPVIRTGFVDRWAMGDGNKPLLPYTAGIETLRPFVTLTSTDIEDLSNYKSSPLVLSHEHPSIDAAIFEDGAFNTSYRNLLNNVDGHASTKRLNDTIESNETEKGFGNTTEPSSNTLMKLVSLVKDGEEAWRQALKEDSYIDGDLSISADRIARIQAGKKARKLLVEWAETQESLSSWLKENEKGKE